MLYLFLISAIRALCSEHEIDVISLLGNRPIH